MNARTMLGLAVLASAIAGCAKGGRSGSGPGAPDDTLATIVRTLHHETVDCATNGRPCLVLDLSYPILTHVPAGDTLALNRDLRRRLNSGMVSGEPPIFADPDSMLTARIAGFQQVTPNEAPWFERTVARVESFWPGLLTLSIALSAYSGGAHPNSNLVYLNLDPKTALEVPLDSVLAPGARDSLPAVAERAFRRARGMAADSSFQAAGFWFKQARFELTPNFGLTDDGLVFHYNPYEVAPYALGPTHAVLPWSELARLVRPGYQPKARSSPGVGRKESRGSATPFEAIHQHAQAEAPGRAFAWLGFGEPAGEAGRSGPDEFASCAREGAGGR